MVVKAVRGRRRYVLFEVDPVFDKESLVKALRGRFPGNAPFVIQVAERLAIVRCSPRERDDVIAMMGATDPKSHSITTSGTLLSIRRRFPVLRVPRR